MSDLTMKDSREGVIWSGSRGGSIYMYDQLQRRRVSDPEGWNIDLKFKRCSLYVSDKGEVD